MIRRATKEDLAAIVAIGERCLPLLKNEDVEYSQETFSAFVAASIEHDSTCVFVSEKHGKIKACIMVTIVTHPITGRGVAMKTLWVMDDNSQGHSMAVLKAAEKWSKERGVTRFICAVPDDRSAKFLKLRGYHQTEISLERVL